MPPVFVPLLSLVLVLVQVPSSSPSPRWWFTSMSMSVLGDGGTYFSFPVLL